MIKEHWRNVWGRFPSLKGKTEKFAKARQLFKDVGAKVLGEVSERWNPPMQSGRVRWERPNFEEVEAKMRSAKGSGGPDGWQREELRVLSRHCQKTN